MNKFLLWLIGLSTAITTIVGCANQGSGPDGGPYDETPPRIASMTPPEKVVGSKRTKFTLTFDELIKVDNPSEKVTVSPEIKGPGRKITVEILDSLIPNTTYTVDFSDAITDNNEGNPLGQYTYIFSTGQSTDTMQISGHVLSAEDLEPMKGILVGLFASAADSLFTTRPFERVGRTDANGYFSIKGVSADKEYSIYALQDSDGDYQFSQPGEAIGFSPERLKPSSFPDVRYDTLWVDSVRYDSVRTIHFTHFTPDDVVVKVFKEARQPRHFLKSQRDLPESFRLFFTAPSAHTPRLRGLNFDEKALLLDGNATNDTLTYWLNDTTLLRQDTLRLAMEFEAWDDSLKLNQMKTDTLELVPRTTFAKRLEAQQKELAKWEKQRERRNKRGDFSNEKPPVEFLPFKINASGNITPAQNVEITFDQPLTAFDTRGIHLRLKVDTNFVEAPFELDTIAHQKLKRLLRAEWRPGQQYEIVVDSAAARSIFGLVNNKTKASLSVGKNEEYGTIFVSLAASNPTAMVQLLSSDGKVQSQVKSEGGRAEIYYVRPGKYFLRCFFDRNGDGKWTPGEWASRRAPEEVYYYREEIEVRANWDLNLNWNLTERPLTQQKPERLVKQKENKRQVTTRQRNLDRLRDRGGR